MLAFGIANIVLGLISVNVNIAEAFLRALFNIVSAPALGALGLMMNGAIAAGGIVQQSTRSSIDWAETGMTFLFAALALIRYATMGN